MAVNRNTVWWMTQRAPVHCVVDEAASTLGAGPCVAAMRAMAAGRVHRVYIAARLQVYPTFM